MNQYNHYAFTGTRHPVVFDELTTALRQRRDVYGRSRMTLFEARNLASLIIAYQIEPIVRALYGTISTIRWSLLWILVTINWNSYARMMLIEIARNMELNAQNAYHIVKAQTITRIVRLIRHGYYDRYYH